jgi:hypothetical protein
MDTMTSSCLRGGLSRVIRCVEQQKLYVPNDLREGSYPWKSYVYANIGLTSLDRGDSFDATIEEKAILVGLFGILQDVHRVPWVRQRLVQLDKNLILRAYSILRAVAFRPCSANVFRAVLWQRYILMNGNAFTDDYVLSLVPELTHISIFPTCV